MCGRSDISRAGPRVVGCLESNLRALACQIQPEKWVGGSHGLRPLHGARNRLRPERHGGKIKTKREDIRELILKLHLQQQKGGSC